MLSKKKGHRHKWQSRQGDIRSRGGHYVSSAGGKTNAKKNRWEAGGKSTIGEVSHSDAMATKTDGSFHIRCGTPKTKKKPALEETPGGEVKNSQGNSQDTSGAHTSRVHGKRNHFGEEVKSVWAGLK